MDSLLRNEQETGAEMFQLAIVSGIVTGDVAVSYGQFFSVSPVTVPEVLANCNLAKFPLGKCGGVYVSVRSPWMKFSCVSSQM